MTPLIIGVDVGAPRRARDQRRKLVAVAARAVGRRAYRVDATGFNARLVAPGAPGWAVAELVAELAARPARVVGLDAPLGVPLALLRDPAFASAVGHRRGAFGTGRALRAWIARHLPLVDPLDFAPFAPWRDPAARARLWTMRATDLAAGAQPPLKDRFQATFQMTLVAQAMLARLQASGAYRVPPFRGGGGPGELIEVYPRATLRAFGLPSYKARPAEAIAAALAGCAAAGVAIAVASSIIARATRYSSGAGAAPDHDVADALVALCTAILYAEGACAPALPPGVPPSGAAQEGAIWVPARRA